MSIEAEGRVSLARSCINAGQSIGLDGRVEKVNGSRGTSKLAIGGERGSKGGDDSFKAYVSGLPVRESAARQTASKDRPSFQRGDRAH